MKMIKSFSLAFSTAQAKTPEFLNYYLLSIEYGQDGYYETFPHRKVFLEQLKKVEDSLEGRILGGDNFPKTKTTLLFNCNSIETVEKFVKGCVYSENKMITKSEIEELDIISNEKFEKIWQFYQPKVI